MNPVVTFTPSARLSLAHLMVCDECAALVMYDPRDDGAALERHAEWHRQMGEDR